MSISEQTDAILRAAGDTLLQLGADTPRRVPNTPVNTASLNAAVAQYQRHLDTLELDIMRSLAEARRRAAQPPADEPQQVNEKTQAAPTNGPEHQELDFGLDHARLDQGLDADLFDMDTNDLGGLFDTGTPAQSYSIDDDFF